MSSDFSPSFMQGAGFQNPGVQTATMPNDFAGSTQSFDPVSLYDFVSSPGQLRTDDSASSRFDTNVVSVELAMPPYVQRTQGTSQPAPPSVNDRSSAYSSLPSTTNSNLGNIDLDIDALTSLPPMPANLDDLADYANQLNNFNQPTLNPSTIDSTSQYSYIPQTTTQSPVSTQTPGLSAAPRLPGISQEAQARQLQMPHSQGQAATNGGAGANTSGVHRHNRHAPWFPQSGSLHQRRHSRHAPYSAVPITPSHQHQRPYSGAQSTRVRPRPPNIYTSGLPYQDPSQPQRTHHSTNLIPTPSQHAHSTQPMQAVHHIHPTSAPAANSTHQQPQYTHPYDIFANDLLTGHGQGQESLFANPDWINTMAPGEYRALYQAALVRAQSMGIPLDPETFLRFHLQQQAQQQQHQHQQQQQQQQQQASPALGAGRSTTAGVGGMPLPTKKPLDTPSEPRPSSAMDTKDCMINMECKICMSQLVDTVLLPCGHAVLCRWCADQHIPSQKGYPVKGARPCPMCRESVRFKHRIYFP
ncbi:C3HC4 finger protein [Aspergillus stella-maris]|uniref:C3HC4 finger protein n=1 Tax=Aspergillus stella-maris TaxID=1810926 RepID=UPI003CCE3FDB